MTYNVSIEKDGERILAIYIRVREGEVRRTVEIDEGACYVDEDADGHLLGVEVLTPDSLRSCIGAVKERYRTQPDIDEVLRQAADTVRV